MRILIVRGGSPGDFILALSARQVRLPSSQEDGQLPEHLVNYFSSFRLIVSHPPDGDGLFRRNLLRAGAQRVISAPNLDYSLPGE